MKKQIEPVKIYTPKEKLGFEIEGLKMMKKYHTEKLIDTAKHVKDSFVRAGEEYEKQVKDAASDEYIAKSTLGLTSAEVASWAVNSILWVLPNAHVQDAIRDGAELDKIRKELDAKQKLYDSME
jgi:hypothetical protein